MRTRVATSRKSFDGRQEEARSLIRTAIVSRLLHLEPRGAVRIVRDLRGLANELVETLSDRRYRDALQQLSERTVL